MLENVSCSCAAYLWSRERRTPAWQTRLERRRGGRRRAVRAPRQPWQRDGCHRDAPPGPHSRPLPPSPASPPSTQSGWEGVQRPRQRGRATPSHRPKGCPGTFPQLAGVGWGQRRRCHPGPAAGTAEAPGTEALPASAGAAALWGRP